MASVTITGNGETDLGAGGDAVASLVFQVTGTWTGNLTPKARAQGVAQASSVNVAYVNLATGADVAAGTAITANGLFAVKAGGLVVSLSMASFAGTSAVVEHNTVAGVVQ
jgi:hypothetical protein